MLPKKVPKISAQIWRPLIDLLEKKITTACLRRDAYLVRVLEVEVDWLDREVAIPNSEASRKWVNAKLTTLNRKVVSLALPPPVVSRLNEVCHRKRIVRDAFFNRLFFLLAMPPNLIELFFRDVLNENWRLRVVEEEEVNGPFFQNTFYPLEPDIDPFWALRTGIELSADSRELQNYTDPTSGRTVRVMRGPSGVVEPANGVYTTFFDMPLRKHDLTGLSCYLPDWRIPGHADQKEVAELGRALLEEFEASASKGEP